MPAPFWDQFWNAQTAQLLTNPLGNLMFILSWVDQVYSRPNITPYLGSTKCAVNRVSYPLFGQIFGLTKLAANHTYYCFNQMSVNIVVGQHFISQPALLGQVEI